MAFIAERRMRFIKQARSQTAATLRVDLRVRVT
jgi:hypothetical protein